MEKKKAYNKKATEKTAKESAVAYKRELKNFNSFEEQAEYELKQMAKLTPVQLMDKLEQMRKIFLKQYLLPDGSWQPIKKIIQIQKPHK